MTGMLIGLGAAALLLVVGVVLAARRGVKGWKRK